MIIFSEKDHKYIHVESGNVLKGWTSLIKNYTKEFPEEAQLECSAYKLLLGNEEYNKLVKARFNKLFCLDPIQVSSYLKSCVRDDVSSLKTELKYEWDYAKILGSEFHKERELESYARGYEVSPFDDSIHDVVFLIKEYDNESAADHLYDLKDGYYPELLVWDYSMGQEYSPVTQIDRCWLYTDPLTGIRYSQISDIKTNKNRPYESKCDKMKAPLDVIHDNTLEKYKLQVMFGAKLLETHGFTPKYCGVEHFMNYDINTVKLYLAKYDKELMNKLQESYKNRVKQKP